MAKNKKKVIKIKRKLSKKVAKKVTKKVRISVKSRAKTAKQKTTKVVKKLVRIKKIAKPKRIQRKPITKKKNNSNSQTFDLSPNSIFRPKIRVIGIGGGGGSIVSEIGRSLKKASFIIADTDIRAIKKKAGIKYFYFGEEVTHGLGTGMNPDLAKEAAEREKDRISKLLEGQDIVILVSSLGGGLGSGATSVFAELSQRMGNVTLGIFTLPFKSGSSFSFNFATLFSG